MTLQSQNAIALKRQDVTAADPDEAAVQIWSGLPEKIAAAPMLAFTVKAEEFGCVVFAKSHMAARRLGANDMSIEFESVESCQRSPEFDHYAPGPMTAKALIEAGWRQECNHCQATCPGYNDAGKPLALVFEGCDVYCSKSCADGEKEAIADDQQRRHAARELVAEKWPGAVITSVYVCSTHEAVTFSFPGCRHPAMWRSNERHVSICRVDELAWQAFAAGITSEVAG